MTDAAVPAVDEMMEHDLALRQGEDDPLALVGSPAKLQKTRSLSDSTPQLSPSPKFREARRTSKDDHAMVAAPRTPRRPDLLSRGLSLQMPPRELTMPSPAHFAERVPLSPQLDARNTFASSYTSPGSALPSLPRRSRGAEFSRACTNLHHSTLADPSSPDSSPTITQKGMMIPSRTSRPSSMVLDSPHVGHALWGNGNGDRAAASSSVGSMTMFAESSSSSDEGDPMDPDDHDDQMLMTPQALKAGNPFAATTPGHTAGAWSNMFSPNGLPHTFMSIQRARLRKGRSRKSSSSASGHSSMPSPVCASPPTGKSEGYFGRDSMMRKSASSGRRESLSMFANELHISSGNDSGDEATVMPQTPHVVRRPVTRRANLLKPKSRQFGRIKAELFEESAPIDSEFRREAEVIRQVRENEEERPSLTAQSSPSLLPTVPGLEGPLEGVPEEGSESNMSLDSASTKGLFAAFNLGAIRNSNGRGFWSQENPAQTPPPSFPGAASSVVSDDINMCSPAVSSVSTSLHLQHATAGPSAEYTQVGFPSRASTPQPLAPPSAADALKKSHKRRRDDDLDVNSIKRRAVSPGLSVHNSPVLSQSPAQRDGGVWGSAAKASRDQAPSNGTNGHGPRSNSAGSASMTPSFGPKRVGLQGMTDTSDGLMKMSIE